MNFSSPTCCLSWRASAIRLVVAVDGRQRAARVHLGDMGDVAAEDGRVQRLGVWQVVGHEQELAAAQPRVMLGDDVGEALLAAGVGVARRIACSTAMKCDLPEPNEPSR